MKVSMRPRVLSEHLARRNLSLSEFSGMAKLAKASVSRILAGKAEPRPATRGRLLRAAGMTFDELFVIEPTAPAGKLDQSTAGETERRPPL